MLITWIWTAVLVLFVFGAEYLIWFGDAAAGEQLLMKLFGALFTLVLGIGLIFLGWWKRK